jgi:hypothetical protein
MGIKSKSVAAVAALSMFATPAFAQDTPQEPAKSTTAPGQICKAESKKKTMQGKGKSPFAACVIGAKRAQKNAEQVAATADQPKKDRVKKQNPTTMCKTLSKKKAATDKKSPFAACVSGAAKAQREAKQAA